MNAPLGTIVLAVPSAHCGQCRCEILEALNLAGVAQSEVDLCTREATIIFEPERIDHAAIAAALTAAGHPPEG